MVQAYVRNLMNKYIFTFQDSKDYRKHLCDTGFWYEAVNKILLKHKLIEKKCYIQSGYNGTYKYMIIILLLNR